MNETKTRLRPVVYTVPSFNRGAQNTTQQMFLLKALQITSDPRELRKMIGVRTVAEVFRTLDKLAMRKEYHAALARQGISFDFIVSGLKEEAAGGEKSADRIKALQVLLKSLGLDKYDNDTPAGGTWEEELLKSLESSKEDAPQNKLTDGKEYEVIVPVKPERVQKKQDEEAELLKSIYE